MTMNIKSAEKLTVLYTTTSSLEEAAGLARGALENKLAACVNIVPNGISLYYWDGEIQQSSESYLLLKTTEDKISELTAWLVEQHPYNPPAVLISSVETTQDFYNYIQGSLE